MKTLVSSYLPGESARASLKQQGHVAGRDIQTLSPGRIGPGLIEARAILRHDTQDGAISRANRPGPH